MSRAYGVFKRMFNPLVLSLAVLVAAVAPAQAAQKLILAFGDSLTAGYGLGPAEGFVPRLEARLRADGLDVKVHNAGVSGDTTTGGKARLAWVLAALKAKPDLVILELGANDALRGIDPKLTRANLDAMLADLKRRNIRVLLAGMMAPRNLGQDYARTFDPIYPTLAKAHGVALYPFFLDGVAANPKLNQADGMHPNPQGVTVIVGKLAPVVKQALR